MEVLGLVEGAEAGYEEPSDIQRRVERIVRRGNHVCATLARW